MLNEKAIEDNLTYKVVKDNTLIQKAKSDLTLNEQKLVNYLISLIKPSDIDFKTYTIKISDFAKLVGLDNKHMYRDFKVIIDEIESKSFWFEDDEQITKISWVLKPKYLKKTGTVELHLDPDVKKYLIGLQNNFTEYELYNILSLKSKYAVSIYELLKSHSYKKMVIFGIDEFKENINAGKDSYKSFGLFKQKVLEKAIDDINEFTDMQIKYECLDGHQKVMNALQGRKVAFLKFHIKTRDELGRYSVYQKTKNRIFDSERENSQVPHQISFDTDNDTGDLYDDTTNQKI